MGSSFGRGGLNRLPGRQVAARERPPPRDRRTTGRVATSRAPRRRGQGGTLVLRDARSRRRRRPAPRASIPSFRMLLLRSPHPALTPFVERLWYFDEETDGGPPRAPRERALPTGTMALVFRLSPEPIRVFDDPRECASRSFGHAALVGVRSTFYVRDTSAPSCSVGAHFRPGGAAALLGVPADELAERHTALEGLWGAEADRLRPRRRLDRSDLARDGLQRPVADRALRMGPRGRRVRLPRSVPPDPRVPGLRRASPGSLPSALAGSTSSISNQESSR
jgi:hypothetical protein